MIIKFILLFAVYANAACQEGQHSDMAGACICDNPDEIVDISGFCGKRIEQLPEPRDIVSKLFNSTPRYDKLARPDYGTGKATTIKAQFRINSIAAIIPTKSLFTVDLFLRLTWKDPRLAFGTVLKPEVLAVDSHLAWRPDIYFFNEAGKMEELDGVFKIYADGTIFWSRHYLIDLHNTFKLHDFPFDDQKLDIELISFANNKKTMNLSWYDLKHDGAVFPPVKTTFKSVLWSLDHDESQTSEVIFRDNTPSFDKLTYTLYVSRYSVIYMLKYIFPLFIIALLTTVTYWIPVDSVPARVGLCMSLTIANITLNFVIQQELPKVNYPTNADLFITLVFIFNFIALVEFTISHNWFIEGRSDVADKLDWGFRQWAPCMVLLSLTTLFKNTSAMIIVKIFALIAAIAISLFIFWYKYRELQREKAENLDSLESLNLDKEKDIGDDF